MKKGNDVQILKTSRVASKTLEYNAKISIIKDRREFSREICVCELPWGRHQKES